MVEALEEHGRVERLVGREAQHVALVHGELPRPVAHRWPMSEQNLGSSSTTVTSSPVATRSAVRFPQPAPNSTTRAAARPRRAARQGLGEGVEHVAAGDQVPADEGQRAALVGERPGRARARGRTATPRARCRRRRGPRCAGTGPRSTRGRRRRTDRAAAVRAARRRTRRAAPGPARATSPSARWPGPARRRARRARPRAGRAARPGCGPGGAGPAARRRRRARPAGGAEGPLNPGGAAKPRTWSRSPRSCGRGCARRTQSRGAGPGARRAGPWTPSTRRR